MYIQKLSVYCSINCVLPHSAVLDDDDEEPSCRRHSDCVDGERCVITDLGNSSCMSGRYTYMYA